MAEPLSFTDLPRKIRIRIYTLSGLVRFCPIDLNKEGDRQKARLRVPRVRSQLADRGFPLDTTWHCHYVRRKRGGGPPSKRGLECFCPALPLHLLFLCRSIHNEIVPILYGQNKFKLTREGPGGLRLLRTLNPNALAAMTSLHISLNKLGENKALDRTALDGGPVIQDFALLCERMTQLIPISQMKFSLTCNPADVATVNQITKSIEMIPVMKECAIHYGPVQERGTIPRRNARLGPSSNLELGRLAHKTGRYLSGTSVMALDTSFPFNKLPWEIRRLVLTHSDLVAHYIRTQWNYDGIEIHDGKLASIPACCTKCSDCLEGCFCSAGSEAYSTTCVCYKFPTAFFQVSKQMTQEALDVFLSQNRFIFTGPMYSTLHFFRSHVAWLSQLRKVDFRFDETQVRNWRLYNYDQPWGELVSLIKNNLSGSKLWVSIDAGDDWQACCSAAENDREEELEQIHDTYRQIIQPWQRVKDLLKFHVFFSWFYDYEALAEKEVMGEAYDSADEGKIPYESGGRTRHSDFPHGVPSELFQHRYEQRGLPSIYR